ncbi:co-regulatory protein PtrA N-terminal domain-containing protein [Pseudomonas asiatica]|uniref:co-regulatory protein PtrA N-terminal domain-containing protein n=1 Tax=Pseudomonas asiatica TaxID=2219225 RepID=UPI0025704A0D|nr:co-regulatory protein PtrA N-terminal domain-containing protein [Pseudomonas asiatica]WJD72263.1 co-regulatory protein PtrA N-terminal domain-containing protein [Pseudomonas asiatica]
MSPLKIAMLSLALVASTSAFAEGGADRLQARNDALAQERLRVAGQRVSIAEKQITASTQQQTDSTATVNQPKRP